MEMTSRYVRQTSLASVGRDGQEKLLHGSVLIVGAGGLGVPSALYLAGTGVGRIGIVDHDVICLTNLHRQVIYTEKDVGEKKAKVLAQHLEQLNGDIEVTYYADRLVSRTAEALVGQYDIIIDAADNFLTTYMLSDYCVARKKPLVSASVIGTQGYVGVFCHTASEASVPSYRALFPCPPEEAPTCSDAGVLAPVVGVIGMMQAQEAIKILLGSGAVMYGQLHSFDMWTNRYSCMDFSAAQEPVFHIPVAILTQQDVKDEDHLVDVRSVSESNNHGIKNAINIPIDGLLEQISAIDTSQRVVFFCASGRRASRAAFALTQTRPCDVAVMLL